MQSITLQSSDSSVIESGVLGRLGFAASNESDGADSVLVAAIIEAVAEGNFTQTSNATSLVFSTASSSTAEERLKITSEGHFVPFASGQYDLGSPSLPFRNLYVDGGYVTAPTGVFDVISFNTEDESILTKGQLSWDDTEGVLSIGLTDDSTIHIGEHRFFRIRNQTGSALYKGQVVYASGIHSNGLISPSLYVADGTIREVRFMGVILEDVNNNNNGYVVDFGHLHDMDLDGSASNYAVGDETWAAGDILYVHPTVAGKLTKNEPKHSISVAIVLDSGNGNGNGKMFVRPASYGHINDNHDVDTSGLLDNQFLVYNSGLDDWQPSSGLYYVDGDLGINESSPDYKLHIDVGSDDDGVAVYGTNQPTFRLIRSGYESDLSSPAIGVLDLSADTYAQAYDSYTKFSIGGSEKARLNATGFGIGTRTNVTNKLQVEGGHVAFNQDNGSYTFKVGSTARDDLFYVDGTSNDRVGIKTSSPDRDFHVDGETHLDGNTIIGTGLPSLGYRLTVDGNATIDQLNINGNFTFPTTDGSSNQVLQTDGAGNVSWGSLATETSHADVVVDGDFTSTGLMKRGASSGTYSIVTDNSANWNAAYGWGDHGTVGYLTSHPTISAASSSNNSGRTYIQDILLDSNGHVTGITTATETVTDTNTYVSSASFNINYGTLTLTMNDASTVEVDLDGRYATSNSSTNNYIYGLIFR